MFNGWVIISVCNVLLYGVIKVNLFCLNNILGVNFFNNLVLGLINYIFCFWDIEDVGIFYILFSVWFLIFVLIKLLNVNGIGCIKGLFMVIIVLCWCVLVFWCNLVCEIMVV